jgi:hypothetical protein
MRATEAKNDKRVGSSSLLRNKAPKVLALSRLGAWSTHLPVHSSM